MRKHLNAWNKKNRPKTGEGKKLIGNREKFGTSSFNSFDCAYQGLFKAQFSNNSKVRFQDLTSLYSKLYYYSSFFSSSQSLQQRCFNTLRVVTLI